MPPPPPALCGTFVRDKKSLVAFTWSITCLLSLVSLILSLICVWHVHQTVEDHPLTSRSMIFVAFYTIFCACALSLYGSTAIVGFTSVQGFYIAPCFSEDNLKLKVGIFGGAIVFFANLLLVVAVIFGEVRVQDGHPEGEEEEDRKTFEIERIATVMAVTCMFLAAVYIVFALLLFLMFNEDDDRDEMQQQYQVSSPGRKTHIPSLNDSREAFILRNN